MGVPIMIIEGNYVIKILFVNNNNNIIIKLYITSL